MSCRLRVQRRGKLSKKVTSASELQHRYSSSTDATSKEHYQLTGIIALRIADNAENIRCGIEEHCGGSPFVDHKTLVNIVSMMVIQDAAKNDSPNRDEKGEARYEEFVTHKMIDGSPASLRDRVEKLKLKTYSTCMKMATIAVGDKVVNCVRIDNYGSRCLNLVVHKS